MRTFFKEVSQTSKRAGASIPLAMQNRPRVLKTKEEARAARNKILVTDLYCMRRQGGLCAPSLFYTLPARRGACSVPCDMCACGPLCGRRENTARDRARVVRRSPTLTRAVGNASQSPRIGTRRSARRAQRVVPMGRSPGRMYFIAGRTAWALGAFVGRQACSCGVWLLKVGVGAHPS